MYRVKIQNLNDNRRWQADFSTEEQAQSWLAEQKVKIGRREAREEQVEEEQVQFEAEASYEIENLSENYDYLLAQCYKNRRAAYPRMEDYMDAIVKGDDAQAQAYIDACLAVKALYPKPSEE